MATQVIDCTQAGLLTLERVNYFPRQLLTVDDMVADQNYFRAKLRRHNRYLHGWGAVCGLEVVAAPTPQKPWLVSIGGGYALSPFGDEIYVSEAFLLDLAKCGPGAATDPCEPTLVRGNAARTGAKIFVAIRYQECLARPVRIMPGGCGCEETACENSRLRDSFQIQCLEELPASHPAKGPTICDIIAGKALAICPPCPNDPWVVLAAVTLPAAASTAVAAANIDNFIRRQVFSTAAIQEQLIQCCCRPRDRRPARVTSINPAAGAQLLAAPPAVVATFDKNLQADTVTANTFQVIRIVTGGPSETIKAKSVAYDDGARSATFTPSKKFVAGQYQVTLIGSGPSPILDSDTLALDGNNDGLAGGNFISTFFIGEEGPAPVPFTFTASAQPNTVRAEGRQELVGPMILTGVGGTAGQRVMANVQIFLNTDITNSATDQPILLIDDPANQIKGGKAAGNSYLFKDVPVDLPGAGGAFVLRITNVRADASKLGGGASPANVTMLVTITAPTPLPVINPTQIVAFIGTQPVG